MALRTHLEALPQELYDEIHKHTFIALEQDTKPENGIVEVSENYRTPKLLHINHNMRLEHAAGYYFRNKFTAYNSNATLKFLDRLGENQRQMLRHFEVKLPTWRETDLLNYNLKMKFGREFRSKVISLRIVSPAEVTSYHEHNDLQSLTVCRLSVSVQRHSGDTWITERSSMRRTQ